MHMYIRTSDESTLHWLLTHSDCHFVAVIYGKYAKARIKNFVESPVIANSCLYFAARWFYTPIRTCSHICMYIHIQMRSHLTTKTEAKIIGGWTRGWGCIHCSGATVTPAATAINVSSENCTEGVKCKLFNVIRNIHFMFFFRRWLMPLNSGLWLATVLY